MLLILLSSLWVSALAGTSSAPSASASSVSAPSVEDIATDPAQESTLLKAAGQGFHLKRTRHFLIAYDAERTLVDEFTLRVESTYAAVYRFCDTNKITSRRPRQRLEIIFFDHRAGYEHYCEELSFRAAGTYGVYYEPTNRSAFFNVQNDPELQQLHTDLTAARDTLDQLIKTVSSIRDPQTRFQISYGDGQTLTLTRTQAQKEIQTQQQKLKTIDGRRALYSERINRTVIQHEVAHQVLFNAGVHVRGAMNPKWLVEGLACLFETPPDQAGSGMAAVNQLRLHDFRKAVAGTSSKPKLSGPDLAEAVDAERLTSPAKLISESSAFSERGQRGGANYAEAWALIQFLQRMRTGQLVAYIQEISARRPGTPVTADEERRAFEKHFGPLDKSFLHRWGDFIFRLDVRATPGL
jgi:hypothetical protein